MKKNRKSRKNKNNIWLVRIPLLLANDTREFVEGNNSSISNFVRKAIRYLTEDETPHQNGKRAILWAIQLPTSYHRKAIELVKSNYPSRSSFLRYAVTRQLVAEKYMDEETKRLLSENQRLKDNIISLKSEIEQILDAYYELQSKLRELRK